METLGSSWPPTIGLVLTTASGHPFFLSSSSSPASSSSLHVTISPWAVAQPVEPHRTPPWLRWGPPLAVQAQRGEGHAAEPELMWEPNQLLLQRRAARWPSFSPPQLPRAIGLPRSVPLRCPAQSWEEQPNAAPLSLSFFFPECWHGRPNPTRRCPGTDGGHRPRLGLDESVGMPLGPNQGGSRTKAEDLAPAFVEGLPAALSPSLLGHLEWPGFSLHRRRSVRRY